MAGSSRAKDKETLNWYVKLTANFYKRLRAQRYEP